MNRDQLLRALFPDGAAPISLVDRTVAWLNEAQAIREKANARAS